MIISFGVDARHLMARLLEHAGASAIGPLMVLVQPEARPTVLALLREAAAGSRIVRLDGEDGTRIDTLLHGVAPEGLFGAPVNDGGAPLGPPVLRIWRSVERLHFH
jgi:hypothetical protein